MVAVSLKKKKQKKKKKKKKIKENDKEDTRNIKKTLVEGKYKIKYRIEQTNHIKPAEQQSQIEQNKDKYEYEDGWYRTEAE